MPRRELSWHRYDTGTCTHPECMVRSGGALSAQRFPALVFRLHHPVYGQLLFDTGYSRHFIAATSRFPETLYRAVTPVQLDAGAALSEQLAAEGIATTDIAMVFLSHLHGDHIGGLHDFPQARLWCAKAALDDLSARSRLSALRVGLLPALLPDDVAQRCTWIEDTPVTPLPPALQAFGQGHDLLGDGSLLAISLPGHAAGHYGLFFLDASGPVFLVGDASWSSRALRDHALPPRMTTAWLGDTARYRETFARLHALTRDAPEIRLVPSHCPEWLPDAG